MLNDPVYLIDNYITIKSLSLRLSSPGPVTAALRVPGELHEVEALGVAGGAGHADQVQRLGTSIHPIPSSVRLHSEEEAVPVPGRPSNVYQWYFVG